MFDMRGLYPHPAHSCPAHKDEAPVLLTELSSKEGDGALDLYESIFPHGLWDEQKLSQKHF